MQVPKTIREIHKLTGCLAALSRFLSRAAEKQLPFFKILRRAPDFAWREEHNLAFIQLKEYLAKLPTLSAPKEGELLSLYLAASDEAVSAVLVREEPGRQLPIYFISRALKGPEIRYSNFEKIALALVNAKRRLRPYFQAHSIQVLTDLPLRQILSKPESSGRIAKWALELGEHDLSYLPRPAIKGQALADFLVEAKFAEVQPSTDVPTVTTSAQEPPTTPKDCWQIYVDGASCKTGSGAGILLLGPDKQEITYALRFTFPTTNNEVEYEALISGLRLAKELKVDKIQVFGDSQVVVNQVLGKYEAKEERMQQYLAKAKEMLNCFKYFTINRIPRGENTRADVLSKLASSSTDPPVEKIQSRSIDEMHVGVITEAEPNWMTPIRAYLVDGVLPSDKLEAKKLMTKSQKYLLHEGILYRRSYLQPLLRCLGPEEANYVLQEIHMGSCGSHIGSRALSRSALKSGYYWPTIILDSAELVKKCSKCQIHSTVRRAPQVDFSGLQSPWPFMQWGIDIVGPFDRAPGQLRYLVVAIDYFTKWVEAEPLSTLTSKRIRNFVWKNIVCRFGIPHILVSDNGTQFTDKHFKDWCAELQIKQHFTSVAHPQANGQTEVTNRTIVQGLRKRLDQAKGEWVDNLPQVLWSFRTTPRTSHGETPFSLVYGTEAVIPAEIGAPSPRTLNFEEENNEENLRVNLDALEERRELAFINEAKYKSQVAKYYNKRVKNSSTLQVGELVLRNNEASRAERLSKLEPTWEGPYRIHDDLGKGAYKLAHLSGTLVPRTWNIIHLRRYFV